MEFKKYTKVIKVNGHAVKAEVTVQIEEDDPEFLIAAAPELLRELKSAIFYIESFGGEVTSNFAASGNLDVIKAIIHKAEGESK